jgi:hypothetical protein
MGLFGATFHEYFYGPWEVARGYLVEELEQMQASLESRLGDFTEATPGDILYGNSTGEWQALAIGAQYTVLKSTGSFPQWGLVSLANNVTGTLPATNGGTGLTTYTVGDILYADTTSSLARLADVATGNALISGGVGVAPSWGKIGLTTHVTGTLGVGNGGTGTATAFTAGSVVFAGASGVYAQDNSNLFWDDTNNRLGIGTNSPTAGVHIRAGSAAASSAPIKLVSGTVMTSPEAGAIEFTTDDLFFTISTGPARKGVILDNGTRLTSGKIPVATTNGRLIDLTPSSAYTVTNGTTDRSYDADAYTGDEIADVLSTLIADLQAKGILG